MNNSFQEFYRIPAEIEIFAPSQGMRGAPGFFRLGENGVGFAAASRTSKSAHSKIQIPDLSQDISVQSGRLVLPFDLDEATNNIRWEVYAGLMQEQKTMLGANPLVRQLYYWTRPLLPVPVRSTLQRIKLHGELNNPFPRWPVDRSVDLLFEKTMAAAISANGGNPIPFIWFWPNGKQAAFMLTHDVEDEAGKAFCASLMDIDDEFGFKASFQVVPEKRYQVEARFLQQFRDRNFEICVHDLNHDGNLYRERSEFQRRAKLINRYCEEFGAQGFRSGVLYRNLRWYGDFRFAFDMSVPNVAHLDPQGGGCCTVMPFFVGDIVELPVTLTQDYSLFHILHQHSIDLWKQQIKIIVDGHGLISVIIHPDYVSEPHQQRIFRELLQHVREQCSTQNIWAATPSEINSWWRKRDELKLVSCADGWRITGDTSGAAQIAYAHIVGGTLAYTFTPPANSISNLSNPVADSSERPGTGTIPPPSTEDSTTPAIVELTEVAPAIEVPQKTHRSRRPLRVGMVSYSFYETDNRVLRYASTLAKRGDYVDVFALRREEKPAEEDMEGVHVHRLQGRILNEKSRLSYAWRICQFLLRAALQVAKYDLKNHYDILHIHSVPDLMVASALVPRLRGTPVILDIHDILPEFYASKFASGEKSGLFQVLVGVERVSCRFASHVIIANDIWRERLLSRSLTSDKCTVVLNSPDRSIFSRSGNGHPPNGKFLMLYPGSLNWHQGLDIAIRAFAQISKKAPQAEFHIYGDGPSKPELLELVRELGVGHQIKMPSARPLQEIAQIMETASLGVVPKRSDNFGNEAFSTKILEFMAMGVPVIVSDTMIDKFYFDNSTVSFFRSGDVDDLARCMLKMIEDPQERQRQIETASRFVDTIDWNAKQHQYLDLVDRLAEPTQS